MANQIDIIQVAAGAELRTTRDAYFHHGIHVGGGWVVHRAGLHRKDKATAEVRQSTFAEFADGRAVELLAPKEGDSPGEVVVQRALGSLGTKGYDLLNRNCEHFARWCRSGVARSGQVTGAVVLALVVGGVVLLATSKS